jgi:hypothetical protein
MEPGIGPIHLLDQVRPTVCAHREITEEGVTVTAKVAEWVVNHPVRSSDWLARAPATPEGTAAQG